MSVPAAERMMVTARTLRRERTLPDTLFFLAHPETISVGLKGRTADHLEDLLVPEARLQEEGIPLTRSIRGGGITYHWPGQVICYPVMELQGKERNIPEFMNRLEQVGIDSLATFGIEAHRRSDTPAHIGLWHDSRKIVSMGIRISGWITSFGFAINHSGDYSRAAYVRPCGIEGLRLITMEDALTATPPRFQVVQAVKKHFEAVFGRECKSMPPEALNRLGV
jgi:lipoate-protein ligase B